MLIKLATIIILLIGFSGSSVAELEPAEFDQAQLESLKKALTQNLIEESYNQYVPDLLKKGVPNGAAVQMLMRFGTVAMDCIFDAAKLSAKKRSIEFSFAYVEATLETTNLRPLFRDDAQYREMVGPCFEGALKKSGISSFKW